MQKRFLSTYGPWAVVTGASSGIGREMALCLAEQGFNLVLVARRQGILTQMADDFRAQYRVEVRTVPIDFATLESVSELEAKTKDLDIGLLIAAAGFGTSGPFLDSILEQEINMLQVNCHALLAMTLLFGRRFAQRGRGGIVLMSSMLAFHGAPNIAHYSATKAYVQSLAEALHVELAPLGVDVLASAPGPVHSGFASRAGMRMGMIALKPEDVARPTLNALGRQATVQPGLWSKLIPFSGNFLPRWARVKVMGLVLKQMTKHQQKAREIFPQYDEQQT